MEERKKKEKEEEWEEKMLWSGGDSRIRTIKSQSD